jgi:hypothetical protein
VVDAGEAVLRPLREAHLSRISDQLWLDGRARRTVDPKAETGTSRATPLPVQTIRGITARASPDALWMASFTLASLYSNSRRSRARNQCALGMRARPPMGPQTVRVA